MNPHRANLCTFTETKQEKVIIDAGNETVIKL